MSLTSLSRLCPQMISYILSAMTKFLELSLSLILILNNQSIIKDENTHKVYPLTDAGILRANITKFVEDRE